jgi:hypothetical protein
MDGDLPITASPGGTAHVSVTSQYTSKLLFDDVTTLNATPSTDGATHFVMTNGSAQDFGPMSFLLHSTLFPAGVGSFALTSDGTDPVPICSPGITLHPGDSCQWLVSYTNATGAGTKSAALQINVPGIGLSARFDGVGNP